MNIARLYRFTGLTALALTIGCESTNHTNDMPATASGAADATPTAAPDTQGPQNAPVVGPGNAPPPPHQEPHTAYDPPVELELDPGVIKSGEEIYVCQVYGNPFASQDVDVVMFESETDYSHHHFVFMSDQYLKPTVVYPCSEIPPTMPFAFTAQGNDVVNNYDEGMGVRIQGNQGLMVQAHYANPSADAIHPISKIRMYPGKPGAVTTHVGVFFFLMGPGAIPVTPPHSEITFPARSCDLKPWGNEVNIMWMVGHLHSKGTRVGASIDGQKVYETREWNDPRIDWLEPRLNYRGPKVAVTWDCDYRNDTNRPLMFGEGYSDTMCAVFGGYYPADPNNPTQNCLELGVTQSAPVMEPSPPVVSGPYTGTGAVTMGAAETIEPTISQCGMRPTELGAISDSDGGRWIVPADVQFANPAFPVAADLYNPCTQREPTTLDQALSTLSDSDIVTVDTDGEVISAYIFADNYFEMYVNGVPVGKDPVPYTDFNSSIVRFRAKRPFVVAVHAVDWETHLGLGTEPFTQGAYTPGDAGFIGVFKDAAGQTIDTTDASWKVQVFYTSPVQDLSCLQETGTVRDSSACATRGSDDGSKFYGVHWHLPDDWQARSFDDSAWPAASVYTNETVGVGNKPAYSNFGSLFDDPAADASFIWSSNLILDNEILVRHTLP